MLVTSEQLRAARAMVRLDQEQLAERANVHASTVIRLEQSDGPIPARHDTVLRLQRALEAAGVEFLPNEGLRRRRETATAS